MMVNQAIQVFLRALSAGWNDVLRLQQEAEQPGMVDDWAQALWESIVESSLPSTAFPVRLAVYGEGADCHPRSSRFSFPDDLPTHEVRCFPIDGSVRDHLTGRPLVVAEEGYALDRFVVTNGSWYEVQPPFDHVLIELGGQEYVAPVSNLSWRVVELQPQEKHGSE